MLGFNLSLISFDAQTHCSVKSCREEHGSCISCQASWGPQEQLSLAYFRHGGDLTLALASKWAQDESTAHGKHFFMPGSHLSRLAPCGMGFPFPKLYHSTWGSNHRAIKQGEFISFPKRHSYQLYQESTWTHEIHLFVFLIIYPSMSPFYQHLVTMVCHKYLETGIIFPPFFFSTSLFFLSSFFLSLKFLPMVKPQQEGK